MIKKKTRVLSLLFTACGFISCQTAVGVLLPERPNSLSEIHRAIGIISGRPRSVSRNDREILSEYFGRKIGAAFDPKTAPERLYAHFWILGDSRPYDIRVQVISERKINGEYSVVGEDVVISQRVANELNARLVQGQDGSNVIDSFRPF